MSARRQLVSAVISVSLMVSVASTALAAEMADHPAARNIEQLTFGAVPGLPTCAPGAVQSGDPRQGSFIILAKLSAGCSIPWHWHNANEHLMMVRGEARIEAKDSKPFTLRADGFAMMPSRHMHQFTCTTACSMFVYSDGAFDIHYVNASGSEISADAALKAVKETAAKPPQ